MSERIKSRVLVREEKGIGSISLKRIIFSGLGAGFLFNIMNLTPLRAISFPMVFILFFSFIILSGNRFGIPLYLWFWKSWQGRLLLAARRSPQSLAAWLCKQLNWDIHDLTLDGNHLFAVGVSQLDDWEGIELLDDDNLDAGGFEIMGDDIIVIDLD